jgi:hypothetical protein
MWWDILKMPHGVPTPGSDFKTKEAYYRGSREQRLAYHTRMASAARRNLKILQRRMTGQTGIEGVTDADPVVDEDPINQEIDRLQEMYRFHRRQLERVRTGTKQDFFTLKEENNRLQMTPQTTRTGSKIVHEEISQEEYDKLSNKDKINYHQRLFNKYRGNDKLRNFHQAMFSRLNKSSNLPTFSKYREGYSKIGREYTKEEYLQMSTQDKKSYHFTMYSRAKRKGDKNLSRWHEKMASRLKRNSNLPNYYSPEHEAEESS